MKVVSIIFATSISLGTLAVLDSIDSEIREYTSFGDFLNDLKATADDMIDYVTKVQALLCPDQPVCGADGELERRDVFGELPVTVTIGNLTMTQENIHNSVGICCLPCSCSDTCWQDDNCCPAKQLMINKNTTDLARKRCIAASVGSYNARPSLSSYHTELMYLMTTVCLLNTTNITILENCQNPGTESLTNVIPVTSRKTGNTYWNRACAVCNNDDDDLMDWTSHIIFNHDIAYFLDSYEHLKLTTLLLPENFEEMFAMLRRPVVGDIIYEAPVPMDNMCVTRQSVRESYCEIPPTEIALGVTDWLYESCRHLYSPVTEEFGQLRSRFYRNIFCLFCLRNIQLTEKNPTCKREQFAKVGAGYITALIDYEMGQDKTNANKAGSPLVENICGCNAVHDPYLKLCRPSYCPAGEFSVGCTCIQALQNLSGMPILLYVNVTAKLGQTGPFNEKQLMRLKKTLSQKLKDIAAHISVEIPLIFQQANATDPYYIFTMILRSEPEYDTKLTMEPFTKYLDTDEAFDVQSTNIIFSARFTSKIWRELWKNATMHKYHAHHVERPATKFKRVYSVAGSTKLSLLATGNCQKFSRLFYCTQVQLNESEYFETTPGMITINVTDSTFSVTDFYKTPSSDVRVCADEYLKMSKEMARKKNSGEGLRRNTLALLMVLVLIKLGI